MSNYWAKQTHRRNAETTCELRTRNSRYLWKTIEEEIQQFYRRRED